MSKRPYQVQYIIDRRYKNNQYQYLVKWKGYSQHYNSWEPQMHFLDKQMVSKFDKSYEDKRNKHYLAKKEQIQEEQIIPKFGTTLRTKYPTQSYEPQNPWNEKHQPFQVDRSSSWANSFRIHSPTMEIQGLYIDSNNRIWFNIIQNGKQSTISRESVIKKNFISLIEFYEKNIKIYPK